MRQHIGHGGFGLGLGLGLGLGDTANIMDIYIFCVPLYRGLRIDLRLFFLGLSLGNALRYPSLAYTLQQTYSLYVPTYRLH